MKLYHFSKDVQKLLESGVVKDKGTWAPDFQPYGFFTTDTPKHCIEVMKGNAPIKTGEGVLEMGVEVSPQRVWETDMVELSSEYERWVNQNWREEWGYTAKNKWTDFLSQRYDVIIVKYPPSEVGWQKEVIILEPSVIKGLNLCPSD